MCGDASERTRERLVAVVRTPRRHIYVRATRKQRPPVCFASNHEGFRTFSHSAHGFQFLPRNRSSSARISSIFSAAPPLLRGSILLGTFPLPKKLDRPRAIPTTRSTAAHLLAMAIRKRNSISSRRLQKVQSSTILYHLSTISFLIDRIFNSFPRERERERRLQTSPYDFSFEGAKLSRELSLFSRQLYYPQVVSSSSIHLS